MFPESINCWGIPVDVIEAESQENQFCRILRQLLARKEMRQIGQLISKELRGQAKLLEEYKDRESQQRLILAAELIQDTTDDITAEYGV